MQQRIIKFRVWDVEKKHLCKSFICDGFDLTDNFDFDDNYIFNQFTGLFDINNKEIYEGDIVKVTLTDATPEGRIDYEEKIKLVKWDSVELKWGLEYHGFPKFCEKLSNFKGNIEVIGNAFENPELLNFKILNY